MVTRPDVVFREIPFLILNPLTGKKICVIVIINHVASQRREIMRLGASIHLSVYSYN